MLSYKISSKSNYMMYEVVHHLIFVFFNVGKRAIIIGHSFDCFIFRNMKNLIVEELLSIRLQN